MSDQPELRPGLRVVKGDPSPAELAALVAVLFAHARSTAEATDAPATRRPSQWAANHRTVRRTHRPGPGAWRATALPH